MNKLFYLYHDMSLHSFIRWHLEISGTAVIIKLFPWLRFTRIFPNFLYYSTFVLCWVLQCDHRFSFVSNAICTMSTLKFGRRGLCEVTRQHLCRIKVLKNFQIHLCLVKAHKSRAKNRSRFRIRTPDLWTRSLMLYRLSYGHLLKLKIISILILDMPCICFL